jgi:hypothetical protein
MDALRQEASSPYQAVESEEEEELPAIPQNHRFPSGIGSWNPTFQKTKGGHLPKNNATGNFSK